MKLIITVLAFLLTRLIFAQDHCPVTGIGLPTSVWLVKPIGSGKAKRNSVEVPEGNYPLQLNRGDVITSSGDILLSSDKNAKQSSVVMRDGHIKVIGLTSTVTGLDTWDVCPEAGSFFVDESSTFARYDQIIRMTNAFGLNELLIPLPIAFRRGSVRLYAVGTQFTLEVKQSVGDLLWAINLLDGSVAFERDGSVVYQQQAKIKFNAVVDSTKLAVSGQTRITHREAAAAAAKFGVAGSNLYRVAVAQSVVVKQVGGLRINKQVPVVGYVIKYDDQLEVKGAKAVISVNGTHEMTIFSGFKARHVKETTNRFVKFALANDMLTSQMHVTRVKPLTKSIPIPILAARGYVSLYAVSTDYRVKFDAKGDANIKVVKGTCEYTNDFIRETFVQGATVDRKFK